MISVVIPIYDMKNGANFLWRAINSVLDQTYKDIEIIITKDGKMAENTNSGIKKAKGDYVKILYMDDYLYDKNSLQYMVDNMRDAEWIMTATDDNTAPYWTDNIETGNNKLGSPSALMFKNRFKENLLFDENMSWLLDCDYYKRMFEKYGEPTVLNCVCVGIGKGDHQHTNILTNEEKLLEHQYMNKKYE